MSWTGRCHSAFDQSTGGCCCERSKDFDARIRSSCDVSRGNIVTPALKYEVPPVDVPTAPAPARASLPTVDQHPPAPEVSPWAPPSAPPTGPQQ